VRIRNVFLAVCLVCLVLVSVRAQAAKKPAAAVAPQPSLVSFSAGALIVVSPQEYGGGWGALGIIDERPESGWATPEGVLSPQATVIELPERSVLKTLSFDLAHTDGPNRGAKDVMVEMSDTSATSGFQKIGQVVLKEKVDNQTFPVIAEVPGRWVRLTVQTNHGADDYMELMDFRATGTQLTRTSVANISGTYNTDYSKFHVLQEGTSLTGCYEYNDGVLTGGIEGRVLKFTWVEGENRGPAIMVVSADGKKLVGFWWHENQSGAPAGVWNGEKLSDEVGSCPNWAGGAAQQLTKDLEEFGRARVYGINFDTDSAVIRDESKPTLERIVSVLKSKTDWQMTIEGHTDSTGSAAHNQTLSEKRAQSVMDFLTAAGIAATRLKAAGFGASKPVAGNESELGRAQNRRVELVKQ
jgi:outer membrane protein OmpA-like peptidoglycan-associated protein